MDYLACQNIVIAKPTGILKGRNIPKFENEMSELFHLKPNVVAVDLSRISDIDASAPDALMRIRKKARMRHCEIILCDVPRQVYDTLDMVDMAGHFRMKTRDELENEFSLCTQDIYKNRNKNTSS